MALLKTKKEPLFDHPLVSECKKLLLPTARLFPLQQEKHLDLEEEDDLPALEDLPPARATINDVYTMFEHGGGSTSVVEGNSVALSHSLVLLGKISWMKWLRTPFLKNQCFLMTCFKMHFLRDPPTLMETQTTRTHNDDATNK